MILVMMKLEIATKLELGSKEEIIFVLYSALTDCRLTGFLLDLFIASLVARPWA